MKLALIVLLAGCGAATSSFFEPAFVATGEACYQLGKRAVDEAETRAEAEAALETLEDRCDIALRGIRVAGEIVEEARDE